MSFDETLVNIQLNDISIDYLKNYSSALPQVARIWHECIGKIWSPDTTLAEIELRFQAHMNDNALPLTMVAIYNGVPIAMCSLRANDGIIIDNLTPWLGSLVVDPPYQRQGVGKKLIDAVKQKTKQLGFDKLFLFAHGEETAAYYKKLNWHVIGTRIFEGDEVIIMENKC